MFDKIKWLYYFSKYNWGLIGAFIFCLVVWYFIIFKI